MAGRCGAAPDSITDAPFLNLLLASLPPPRRLAPLLRAIPTPARDRVVRRACMRGLQASLAGGDLDFMQGGRVGIEVSHLALRRGGGTVGRAVGGERRGRVWKDVGE